MAAAVSDIIVPDSAPGAGDDDDEISIIYSTPVKKGTSKLDAIPVESYRFRAAKRVIDLTLIDYSYPDDDLKVIHAPINPPKRRVFKGECSNSKPEPVQEPEPTAPSTFMCEICVDEKPTEELFRVLGCSHSYCSECMSKYVGSKLMENITNINCPVSGCRGFLEPHHCRSILPKPVFDRWGDALCEAMILGSEKFYCPFKDCSALLIDDKMGGVVLQSECPSCNRLFCAQCRVPWHLNISCAEFKKLDKNERSNDDLMLMNLAKEKKWMRCPKCKFYVEKSEGCLFMLCRCKHAFCYNCGHTTKDHYCKNCKR
ncbi:hypothetical protein ABFX02_12G135100 [Erythranthe guttata]